jgi:predicted phage terminase large subunit-like protein
LAKTRSNPYGIVDVPQFSMKMTDKEANKLASVWRKKGLPVALKKNGKPLHRQFGKFWYKKKLGDFLLKHFDSQKVLTDILPSSQDLPLSPEQIAEAKVKMFSGEMSEEDFKKVILYQYRVDPLYMATHLFKEFVIDRATNLPTPSPEFHRTLIDLYTDPNNNRIAIAAPRGHAKSTLTGFFYVMHQVLFQNKKNVVLVSSTQDLAIRFLRDIKSELESNRNLHALFGPQKSEKWSEKEIQLQNGARIYAKGRGGQVRGLKEKGTRPDLVICDDMEDQELVRSELRRIDLEDWFNGDLIPTMEPKIGQLIFIGTILHESALLSRLLDQSLYPDFVSRRYAAIQPNGEPLWPERFSLPFLSKLKESFLQRGQLPTFYMEYMNDPMPTEGATFKYEYFQKYDELPLPDSHYSREIFVDLGGGSMKKTADDTSMVVLFTDPQSGDMYVQDYVSEKFGTDTSRTLDALITLAHTHNVNRIFIEKTVASNMLASALEREMRKRRLHLRVEYVAPTRGSGDRRGTMSDGKFQRIAQMEAPFKLGVIKIRPWMNKLVEQLLAFPRGQHDDLIDALSYGYMFGKRAKKQSMKKQFRPSTRYGFNARSRFRTSPSR